MTEAASQSAWEVLDRLCREEACRLQRRYAPRLDELAGAAIGDGFVDALLMPQEGRVDPPLWPSNVAGEAWQLVARALALDAPQSLAVFLAAAPDLQARYATIYAYLNDDASLRWATPDLLARLAGPAAARSMAALASPRHPLRRARIVVPAAGEGTARSRMLVPLRVNDVILSALAEGWFTPLAAQLEIPSAGGEESGPDVDHLVALLSSNREVLPLLSGRDFDGKRRIAHAVAARLGLHVLTLRPASAEPAGVGRDVADAWLAARLHDALLLVDLGELPPDRAFAQLVAVQGACLLAIRDGAVWREALPDMSVSLCEERGFGFARRRGAWERALATSGVAVDACDVEQLAQRYKLTGDQIVAVARDLATRMPERSAPVGFAAAAAAARARSAVDLGSLATRVECRAGFDDLVLPASVRCDLEDLAGAIIHAGRVFGDWGFGTVGRGSPGGIAAIFTGASGTGKTMSAGVVGRATQLDVWRIDLSAVVSKYIGETEKNLERIFSTARFSNAILFFDEADALFGKRSEVKDARDRYANIEIAYLLQRLEDHDGPVILATNLSGNIDPAFTRRLHFVIEFPVPDADLRELLWRKAFPADAPLAPDIDFGFLARQFVFTGGDIRAAALDCGFRAAGGAGRIGMAEILRAIARQMGKQGKLPGIKEFGPYHALLAQSLALEAAE
jgi:hypothetical protein